MKKLFLGLSALVLSCNAAQKTTTPATTSESATNEDMAVTYAATITEAELKDHLFTYASDEFEGRETGKPGQKKAIAYLKEAYESLGIPAAQADGNYFQNVPLKMSRVPLGTITINGTSYTIGEKFLTFSAAKATFNEIVYAGYGIEEEGYSDYSSIDVTDKMVLIKAGEPTKADGSYVLSGSSEKSIWSNASEAIGMRSQLALDKGAKGILYLDPGSYGRFQSYFTNSKNNNSGRMQLKNPNPKEFYSFFINEDIAKVIFPAIAEDHSPKVIPTSLNLNIESADEEIASENVVAVLKGSEKTEEYLIISSHLDHIGVTNGNINNGADDDGSGTVAMLEIAEAFKKAKDAGKGPKRSIVFLHVTGEEKGLLGSQYYTDIEPVFPLNKTVANLNIDMIGRIDPKRDGDRNYVYLIGSDKLSTELHELSEQVNQKYANIELDYTYNDENDPNRFYYRSDHYNFAKNNIPIIFYFNGTHDDYHRPSDTPDKINYDLLRNRARLVFHTAWEVANRAEKVIVDKATR